MTWLLVSVLALAASVGRGYLAAVGVLFGIVFVAQIVAALGYGHLFPWSVPGVFSGLWPAPTGRRSARSASSWSRVVGTAGIVATMRLVAQRRSERLTVVCGL